MNCNCRRSLTKREFVILPDAIKPLKANKTNFLK